MKGYEIHCPEDPFWVPEFYATKEGAEWRLARLRALFPDRFELVEADL